jgi:hypothetical protein
MYLWAVLHTNQVIINFYRLKLLILRARWVRDPSVCLSVYAHAWDCNCVRDYMCVLVYPCICTLLLLPNILRSVVSPANWSENFDCNIIYRFILWQVVGYRACASNKDKWRIYYECSLQYCIYIYIPVFNDIRITLCGVILNSSKVKILAWFVSLANT